jgi:hypothetical protein
MLSCSRSIYEFIKNNKISKLLSLIDKWSQRQVGLAKEIKVYRNQISWKDSVIKIIVIHIQCMFVNPKNKNTCWQGTMVVNMSN